MFRNAVLKTYADRNALVGLCYINEKRVDLPADAEPAMGKGVDTYRTVEFGGMLNEHHDYIIDAMRDGCDVMTEKPMAIDLNKLKAILDRQRRPGGKSPSRSIIGIL